MVGKVTLVPLLLVAQFRLLLKLLPDPERTTATFQYWGIVIIITRTALKFPHPSNPHLQIWVFMKKKKLDFFDTHRPVEQAEV